jgi:hypothetical protein
MLNDLSRPPCIAEDQQNMSALVAISDREALLYRLDLVGLTEEQVQIMVEELTFQPNRPDSQGD